MIIITYDFLSIVDIPMFPVWRLLRNATDMFSGKIPDILDKCGVTGVYEPGMT